MGVRGGARPAGGTAVAALLAGCVVGLVATTWRGADRAARTALAAMALGAGANLLVVGVNGGMPLDVGAARAAGLPESAVVAPVSGHVVAGEGTHLLALGDVFPVPGAGVVLSAGDVLLGAGAAGLLVATAAGPRRRERASGSAQARVAVAVLTERRSG
ncbi:DUF5317 family protein [Cellulomonas sp. S1-8]|uniref:DUF5317 family protein n=1 Tax=Cellulomonas sp. S1-8 TaxID=2904790 RepID=UPI002244E4D3|nr:DUF5317 family protein [Cellulomonas sp. S1-8]UZN02272.1 DUF5317 family protein [Cellulomonas sp. S1-8]